MIVVDGYRLDLDGIRRVAIGKEQVSLSEKALARMQRSRDLVLKLANGDKLIYGLNTGVGKNKDRRIAGEELEDFNHRMIIAHCVGIAPEIDPMTVRAAMLIKLNSLVKGYAGVQLEMAHLLVAFLNHDIIPVVNSLGSVGEGDIGLMSYIGLALIGEGKVYYKGDKQATRLVLEELGLTPLRLYAKDGLAIISSNAISFAKLSIQLIALKDILDWADTCLGLSLEAFHGNVTPIDPEVVRKKKSVGQYQVANRLRQALAGSYLYSEGNQTIQDPLSFRNAPLIHGTVRDSLTYVEDCLLAEWESSDDNPMVDVEKGRIISTPHYETLQISLAVEMLNSALSHLSHASVQRILKLGDSEFTHLPRFLSANDEQFFGLQALQKTVAALHTEISHASHRLSVSSFSLAGDMEDCASYLPLITQHLSLISDKLREVIAIELLYSVQALHLRLLRQRLPLGRVTGRIFQCCHSAIGVITDQSQIADELHKLQHIMMQQSPFTKE